MLGGKRTRGLAILFCETGRVLRCRFSTSCLSSREETKQRNNHVQQSYDNHFSRRRVGKCQAKNEASSDYG